MDIFTRRKSGFGGHANVHEARIEFGYACGDDNCPVVDECCDWVANLEEITNLNGPGLQGAIDLYARALLLLEHNRYWKTTTPCEPQLGRRGLYPNLSKVGSATELADLCNLLAFADGEVDYLELCSRIEADPVALLPTVERLLENELLEDVSPGS